MLDSTNPYAPPEPDEVVSGAPSTSASWKKIAWRWELLRLPYNGLVGLSALPALIERRTTLDADMIVDILAYGIAANVLYLLGPITEMYLNWLVDVGERSIVPALAARVVRSALPTAVLFLLGTLFSMILTFIIGFGPLP